LESDKKKKNGPAYGYQKSKNKNVGLENKKTEPNARTGEELNTGGEGRTMHN